MSELWEISFEEFCRLDRNIDEYLEPKKKKKPWTIVCHHCQRSKCCVCPTPKANNKKKKKRIKTRKCRICKRKGYLGNFCYCQKPDE